MQTALRFLILGCLLGSMAITSCSDDNTPTPDAPKVAKGIWVLNQGSWGGNNAGLTYYDRETGTVTHDVFTTVNARGLGELGEDMKRYGSLLYIAVAGSGTVEVVNAKSGLSVKQLTFLDENQQPRQPRAFAFHAGKAYVSLFDGHVARIDTTTLTIEAITSVGPNPEEMAVWGNRLFVANSGGMSFPNYGNTVSMVDLTTFTETSVIEVSLNPVRIAADAYGDLYVLSMGNYDDVPPVLQRIRIATATIETIPGMEVVNFALAGDYAYLYNRNYTTMEVSFTLLNVKDDLIEREELITDGTEITQPYCIGADPVSGDFYIGESDFASNGVIHIFGRNGVKKGTFNTGMNPYKVETVNF